MRKRRQQNSVADWSRRKLAAFTLLTVSAGVVVSLVALEAVLDFRAGRIAASETMAPGLIRYDAELGWKLTPGWSGTHRHHDFAVEYSISPLGFRADPVAPEGPPSVLVLGDSFTFGIGVADEETFVSRLNAAAPDSGPFLNLGVIGYSTDQQLLVLRRLNSIYRPEQVLVVVYLGNDLFDNQRAFPLQAANAKPYFRLEAGRPVLENTPVPLATKPPEAQGQTLANVVLGDFPAGADGPASFLGNLQLVRMLGLLPDAPRVPPSRFADRFEAPLRLFFALVDAMVREMPEADLSIALLPGASFAVRPDSVSAQYQDYLRGQIVGGLADRADVEVVDLAQAIRQMPGTGRRRMYFPNEGHLTPAGHRFVAGWLKEGIDGR